MSWFRDFVEATVATTVVIVSLPVLGPVGAISSAGVAVAVAVGAGTATDKYMDEKG